MKKTVFLVFGALMALFFIIIFTCNEIVRHTAQGKCYSVVEDIPQCNYGILLGTGRSVAYSPYYVARVQAAVDLLKAKKIEVLIISGENLDPNYQEVDSMAADILASVPEATIHLDIYGTDTYTTLRNAGDVFGYRGNYILISQHFHN